MKAQIKYRGYTITWFPLEGKWKCFKDDEIVSGFVETSKRARKIIDEKVEKCKKKKKN